jgi:cell division protein FtsQ
LKDVRKRSHAIEQAVARKRKRRKRSYALYYILLFLFVFISGIILSVTVFFNIDKVVVKGIVTISSKSIVASSKITVGDNLLRINSKQIATNILTDRINVEKVTIKRELPSTLVINITEATPFYNAQFKNKYFVASKGGRIIKITTDKPMSGLMTVNGIADDSIKLGNFLQQKNSSKYELLETILNSLNDYKMTEVSSIDISNSTDILFTYQNRVNVKIGSVLDLPYKIKFVKEIITNRISPEEKGTIDATNSVKVFYEPTPSEPAVPAQ